MICPLMSFQSDIDDKNNCWKAECAWWVRDHVAEDGKSEVGKCAIYWLGRAKV